ncbi:MAG: heme ABC exporter ATP-binding protein CcmA [Xanthomonadales bacterium]|nr:heme ABC exporter ATP-binding protein CcmA [Xanthomonadales bacterium]
MHASPDHERPPLLEARGLAFARNDEPVFGPLDFALHAGEVVLIEGDNGSGKTTLLRVLSGLLAPGEGEIRLQGEPLTLAAIAPQVALLSHANGLKPELTTLENLRFAAGLNGVRPGISPPTALAGVGLSGYEDVPTRRLSAGQKKRVALARVLLAPVALWLLDEPYANLDLDGINLVNRLLENHANRGGAALITSHGAYAYTSGRPRSIPLNPNAVLGGNSSSDASEPAASKSISAGAAPTSQQERVR